MILTPLLLTPGHDIPAPLLAELTALYASHREFHALSGDFPDPDDIRPEQVQAALVEELANPDSEVLLARDAERLVGIAITLAHHPDPADPDPWIGLLMVDGKDQRRGHGRQLASLVEERFRLASRTAVRLAVLANNPKGLAFWTALGYETLDHRSDRRLGRPCAVLRKELRTPRRAARVAVVDPEGSVFLFRYDNVEVGVYWALPGGGLDEGETPHEAAVRELREETGWTDLEPGPLLCTWEHDFAYAGTPVHQHEHIYVTHGPRRDPSGTHLAAAHAEDGILGWRWWTRRELVETSESVWPPRLAELLSTLRP
ncbi:bifunctional GNAT family N-acetyltransferase/NUDIX hydrolase [Streptomyces sp. RY43-2]|uniref:Bifunctional GNAT family N-acetyltransferase/NUDIX hydrolase n=1 Tax=Streptomyces macrolidinus TaxID=2952607 RepID=A0ABT0ZK77_9ACTN|nr:bifunctional GNAT family N-acetyltransferase/NUDIX hydrolase [Streptomyces macrolidinus]MCN9244003.1 bifunctional GNAT family N-acetyltransferase/NUDIX hydrolase [Streptomyces macrolidinus]